jgi:predicted nucleic acid-binding protein
MTAYVLDASVAAKWFLPSGGETLVAESLQVLDGYAHGEIALLVPDLFWPELGNIAWKAVRSGRMSRHSAEEAVRTFSEGGLPTAPSLPLLADAFAIAVTFERTVYDSIYIALAIATGRPLLTADERLANAVASHFPVRWLGWQSA